jgi:hypothetical protein
MKRLLLFLLLFAASCGAQTFDTYYGVTQLPCPNTTAADWTMQKISLAGVSRWVFCTPQHNAYVKRGVYYIALDDTHTEPNHVPVSNADTMAAKYGATDQDNLAYARIKSWGFNSGAPGAYRRAIDSQILSANKVPFTEYMQGTASNAHLSCMLTDQCKNLWDMTTASYDGSHYVVDAYDAAFSTYANTVYAADGNLAAFKTSPYFMGLVSGDTDFLSGFSGACPTAPSHPFDTDAPGSCWASPMILGHGGIAVSSPRQIVNPQHSWAVFTDSKNYTKYALATFLKTRYTTIAALNTAWGTAYATGGALNTDGFGTDGTQVANATTSGSGSGPYTATLHTNIDPFSILIKVSGASIGGDDGHGVLHGTNISAGTINTSTGAISITFTGTPAAAPTITYFWGGWTRGAGFLDESGAKIGNGDTTGAPGATAPQITNQVTDLDDFLTAYTVQLFTVMKNAFTAVAPTKLFFGVSNFGQVPGRDPSRCSILKGAGQVLDVTQLSTDGSTAQSTFIANCLGDHPWTNWETVTAEADSEWYNCPGGAGCSGPSNWPPTNWNKTTQSLRGTFFASDLSDFYSRNTGWVGYDWWAYNSVSFFETTNFGLVSWRDNAYDGVEDVTSTVTCSSPINAFSCGGEQFSYSNFLGPATIANRAIDTALASATVGTVALTPASVLYSNTLTGSTSSANFTLKNTTASAITITSQAVTGTSFSLVAGSSTCVAGMSLNSNGQCSISVLFAPLSVATFTGILTVVASSGTMSSSLTGTGYTATPRSGKAKGPKAKGPTKGKF